MTAHDQLDDDLRDEIAQLAFGTLPHARAHALRLHLPHCTTCRNEFEAVASVAADLALASPRGEPAGEVWDRVLERVREPERAKASELDRRAKASELDRRAEASELDRRAKASELDRHTPSLDPASVQLWRGWSSPSAPTPFTLVPAQEGDWQPTAIEGIEVRRLYLDAPARRVTLLARMAPGTAYPAHVHAGAEECFVLSGDLRVGDLHLHAGDFQRAEPGSKHVVQKTDTGCVLLLASSTEDEFLR